MHYIATAQVGLQVHPSKLLLESKDKTTSSAGSGSSGGRRHGACGEGAGDAGRAPAGGGTDMEPDADGGGMLAPDDERRATG